MLPEVYLHEELQRTPEFAQQCLFNLPGFQEIFQRFVGGKLTDKDAERFWQHADECRAAFLGSETLGF